MDRTQAQVLGAIGIRRRDGKQLPLGSALVQRLVAVLVTEQGRPISRDRLTEVLWADSPPEGPHNNLAVYISRLRTGWDRDSIETSPAGYALSRAVEVDSALFEQLIGRARATDLADALVVYDEALALWRGPAFGSLADEWWARPTAVRLEELRLAAMAERIEVLLSVGEADRAAADSEVLLAADPLRESFVTVRMRALHQGGRSAEALRVAAAFRRRLTEQAGLSASPALDELERQILEHDPAAARATVTRSLRGYVFGELLSHGGQGSVYEATQPSLSRDVAIKVLRKDRADSPEFIRRFEAEAQFVARLEHPSIVPLYDYWREPGRAYLVFRLLRGGSLGDRVARREQIAIEDVDLLVERVGDALHSAHRRGVVHRDVRAANVLYDEDGRPYLADFGIALEHASADEASDDVASFARMLLPLVSEEPAREAQRSLLHRASLNEVSSARDLVVQWRAGRELVTPTPTPHRARQPRRAGNPFIGLRVFDETDAAIFFGRATAVSEVVALVAKQSFVTIVGPSGAGKSSLVRAGVTPRLREQGCVVTTMTPGVRPLFSLGVALRRIATDEQLAAHPDDVDALLRSVAASQPTVLVVDQLEELWRQSVPDDRDAFIGLLQERVVRVIATIRADFYDRPLGDRRLGPLVQTGSYALTTLSAPELASAITGPLEGTGVTAEPGLVAQIIGDVDNEPAPLPLVEFVLASLFDARATDALTLDDYEARDGVVGAIASEAERLYQQLEPKQQEQLRELFASLVTPGESSSDDTRRRAPRAELAHIDAELIERLDHLRLLTFDRDPATGAPTVEIAHEALLNHWPRLREWTDGQREQLRARKALRGDAEAWEAASRNSEHLYRPTRLAVSLERVGTSRLTESERAFLDASIEQRDREASRERRRLRRTQALLAATAGLLIIAVIAGSLALTQRNRADKRAADAAIARDNGDVDRMVAQARADAKQDPVRAALLAAEAYRRRPDWQTAGAIESVLNQVPRGELAHLGNGTYISGAFGNRLIAAQDLHTVTLWDANTFDQVRVIDVESQGEGLIVKMRVSTDEHLVVVSTNSAVFVFDAETGTKLAALKPAKGLQVDIDPTDAGRLAVLGADGLVSVIRWATGEFVFRNQDVAPGNDARFSPDGRVLVTTHTDGTVRFWDARIGALLRPPAEAEPLSGSGVQNALTPFSPDGTLITTVGVLGMVRVWRVADGALLATFPLPPSPTPLGGFFRDNQTLIVATGGGPTGFDLVSKTQLPDASVPPGLYFGALNPQATAMISSIVEGSVVVRALDGRLVGASRSVPLPPGFAPQLCCSRNLLSIDDRGTRLIAFWQHAYVFDLTDPKATWRALDLPGDGVLRFAQFTRDGKSILTVHQRADGKASFQLRDGVSLRPSAPAIVVPMPVDDFAFALSADHTRLAWAYLSQPESRSRIRIYDVATGAELRVIDHYLHIGDPLDSSLIWSLSFNPSATRLAVASVSLGYVDSAFVFDLTDPTAAPTLIDKNAATVEYDPTGRYVAIGFISAIGMKLLDAQSLQQLHDPVKGRVTIRNAGHPTEPIILSDSTCGDPTRDEARDFDGLSLWDAENGREIGVPFPNMTCGFWFPDGSAFGGYDATHVRIYDFEQESWLDSACRFAGRELTEAEWKLYGPKKPYRETCNDR